MRVMEVASNLKALLCAALFSGTRRTNSTVMGGTVTARTARNTHRPSSMLHAHESHRRRLRSRYRDTHTESGTRKRPRMVSIGATHNFSDKGGLAEIVLRSGVI